MEENKDNPAGLPSADEVRKLQDARQAEIDEARQRLAQIINEPIDAADADKALAELEIQRKQLAAYVASLGSQIARAQEQMAGLDCEVAVICRRLYNNPPEK